MISGHVEALYWWTLAIHLTRLRGVERELLKRDSGRVCSVFLDESSV